MLLVAVGFAAELVEGSVGPLDPGAFRDSGGWLAEGGLVTMPDAVGAAGDSAEVREVRLDGELLRERLSGRHGEDVMALRREGVHREVCYATMWYSVSAESAVRELHDGIGR